MPFIYDYVSLYVVGGGFLGVGILFAANENVFFF